MHPEPKRQRIPLLRLARRPVLLDNLNEPLEALELVTSIDIHPPEALPDAVYALKMEDSAAAPELPQGRVGVFCRNRTDIAALHQIFVVQIRGERPLVRKLVKHEADRNRTTAEPGSPSTAGYIRQRRKSFMTPTPLHLPQSRVSPIPDSLHEMVYFKSVEEGEPMLVVRARDVLWMHPLVYMPPAE